MPVWNTTPVDETPRLLLRSWMIFELSDGTRYFAGYNLTEREGRVSSAIVRFDPTTRRGVTSTGRIYGLTGDPGLDGDAEYTLRAWLRINGETDYKDVSSEVCPG